MSRLLFLSRWFPHPPTNGSKLRVYNLLRILASQHEVTLISFVEPEEQPDIASLQAVCRKVHVVTRKPFAPDRLGARLALLSPRPRFIVETWSDAFASQIGRELAQLEYDAVIASQFDTAAYASGFAGHPALFEEIELGLMRSYYAEASDTPHRLRYGLMWAKYRRYLGSLLEHFAAASVASEPERELLRSTVPGFDAVEVIPNCVHLPDYAAPPVAPDPGSLIFTGAFTYHANYDAATWFVSEVYPLIKAGYPGARLTITGDHAGLPFPNEPDVLLAGFVPDIRPLIAGSWVAVVPMRQGGGTRLKILEAMALGVPVVATTKGAEGLAAEPGRHLLIADEPADFAIAVVQLLQDPARRQAIVAEARSLVAARYDWQVVAPKYLALVDRVMKSRSGPLADRAGAARRPDAGTHT
jgi:glycosyltransferase involved in cell wall biosynthesis